MTKKVKICGLKRPEDICAINELKPDYCGFIINFPKSHRNLSPEEVASLTKDLSGDVIPVGVFVDQPIELVADMLKSGTIEIAQLHGKEDGVYIRTLKALTGKPVWKAFQIKDEADIEDAKASPADMVLLDSGQGSGKTFDWSVFEGFEREFALAGGLDLSNVEDALMTKAVLLDVSGGVETDKVKDRNKIAAFLHAVRNI